MKNRSLWIAFFAGMACVWGLGISRDTFRDRSHHDIMTEYCATTKIVTKLCDKYAKY